MNKKKKKKKITAQCTSEAATQYVANVDIPLIFDLVLTLVHIS
jgi:hypothetical protein